MDGLNLDKQRSRMRGEDRRALIMAETKIIFAEKGYRGASTGELARASGITEPILYKHFGNKKKLYIAVLTMIGEQFLDRYQGMVKRRAETDLTDCLLNLLLDYRNAAMQDHAGLHLLMNAAVESNDPEVTALAERHDHEIYTLVSNLLTQAQSQDILPRRLDLRVAAWGTLSLLFALQYRAKANLFEEFNERTIREINRLWFQSLRVG